MIESDDFEIFVNELPTRFINDSSTTTTTTNFIVRIKWPSLSAAATNKDIEVTIFDLEQLSNNNSTGYTGCITVTSLQQAADDLEIELPTLLVAIKRALTTPGGSTADFLYECDCVHFSIKKLHDQLKVTYAKAELTISSDAKNSILKSIVSTSHLRRLHDAHSEIQRLKQENKSLLQCYGECVTLKNNLETELLQKFMVLLNSKKDKIAELERKLKRFERESSSVAGLSQSQSMGSMIAEEDEVEEDAQHKKYEKKEGSSSIIVRTDSSQSQDDLMVPASTTVLPRRKRCGHTAPETSTSLPLEKDATSDVLMSAHEPEKENDPVFEKNTLDMLDDFSN